MCRNIKTLHNFEPPATEDEVRPPRCSTCARSADRRAVAGERGGLRARGRRGRGRTRRLLAELVTSRAAADREVEAAQARARAEKRFGRAA